MEEKLRKQLEYLARYIQLLSKINNDVLRKKGYPYHLNDTNVDEKFWDELLKWSKLFLEVVSMPESSISYTDFKELLRQLWKMRFYIPNFHLDYYLLLNYVNSEFETEAIFQLPFSWIKHIDPRFVEASKVSIKLEGNSIILNIKHGNIITPVFLLVHGAIVLGPFILASHILSDGIWESILQHLNDIYTKLKN